MPFGSDFPLKLENIGDNSCRSITGPVLPNILDSIVTIIKRSTIIISFINHYYHYPHHNRLHPLCTVSITATFITLIGKSARPSQAVDTRTPLHGRHLSLSLCKQQMQTDASQSTLLVTSRLRKCQGPVRSTEICKGQRETRHL